jgi:hypothetical protein
MCYVEGNNPSLDTKQSSMKLGSKEHKAQYCQELIKTYYENIWNDEIYLSRQQEQEGYWRKQMADIDFKVERKKYKTKNEGEKAKFVAERELKMVTDKIAELTEKITVTWPSRIKQIQDYADKN